MNKISVIIPVYNCEKTIGYAINSVMMQNYDNFEVIVINDGSTDNSKSIIDGYVKKYPDKIKLISIKNKGVSFARNLGLDNVSGNVVLFLDGDDTLSEGYFKSIDNNIQDFDILVYGYANYYNNAKFSKQMKNDFFAKSKTDFFEELSKNNLSNPIANKVYNYNIINDIRFNTLLNIGEDLDFFVKALIKCRRYKYVNESYYNYQVTNTGLGFKKRKTILKDKLLMYKNLISLYEKSEKKTFINNLISKAYLQEFVLIYKNKAHLSIISDYIQEYKNTSFYDDLSIKYLVLINLFSIECTFLRKFLCKLLIIFDNRNKYKMFGIKRSDQKW